MSAYYIYILSIESCTYTDQSVMHLSREIMNSEKSTLIRNRTDDHSLFVAADAVDHHRDAVSHQCASHRLADRR
jgi:hypothetical protein